MSSDFFLSPLPHSCIVCGHHHLDLVDTTVILGRYSAELFSCQRCGHEWFKSPEQWLDDAYASPIAETDTGIVARSLQVQRIISSFLHFSNCTGKLLDWGSGSGLLTRLLRDDGYDCFGLEPYTDPVLASKFTLCSQEKAIQGGPYQAVIAIEVFEHLAKPRDFLENVLSITDTLIFTTEIVDREKFGNDWWYYSKETGQHISFFTNSSLAYLAESYGCHHASSRSKSFHIITKNLSNLRVFRLLAGARRSFVFHPLSQLLRKVTNRPSLIMKDHYAAKQVLLSIQSNKSE